jgi:hypothetical protein
MKFIFPTADGKLDADQEQALAEFGVALRRPGAKLLLHLHGGLVDAQHGRETANRLTGPPPQGWGLSDDWTQAYVVWRTGVWETLQNNWLDLAHNDRLYQIVLRKLMEFVAGKLGVPGVAGRSAAAAASLTPAEIAKRLRGEGDRRAPFADVDVQIELATPQGRGPVIAPQDDASLGLEFQDFISQDAEFNNAVADIDAVVNEAVAGRAALSAGDKERGEASYRRLDPRVRAPIERLKPDGTEGRIAAVGVGIFLIKHAGRIAMRSFGRFRTRRDHGFHATLVEEVAREMYGDFVGATIWNMMVKDAADHFAPGGFGLDLLRAVPDDNPVHIVVTAHSAGSIWAARMLEAIKATNKPITLSLFLLAPAARTDLFAEALNAAGDRIVRWRMFTMSDEYERKDAVIGHDKGYIYPSSLLYLVSGLFEELGAEAFPDAPILGMQRFVGATWLNDAKETAAGQRIAAFFGAPDHGIAYSPAPGVTTADTHSGFCSEPLTLASVREFM